MEITLEQLLVSREERWQLQQQLLQQYDGCTLVCLTVIMPGNVKRNRQSLVVAKAAKEEMLAHFAPFHIDLMTERDLVTGFEAYALVRTSTTVAKRMACAIEDNHPLGRLFDMDVIDSEGRPVGRQQVGMSPRRCLLCDNEARFCMRNHSHTQQELLQRINEMIEGYVRQS